MKKGYILASLMIAGALSISAQSKIDYNGQRELLNYKIQKHLLATGQQYDVKSVDDNRSMIVLIDLAEGETIAQLEENGVKVINQRGNLVLAEMPIAQIEEMSNLESVKKISLGEKLTTKLDSARVATGFADAHNGIDLDQAYNGTGVVVGLMDTGFDPNHIAFKNLNSNENRVKRFWNYGSFGLSATYDTADEIAGFTSDNRRESHGTHVLGIMAGAPKGNKNYYGLATHSDIAIAAGTLTTANVLAGAEKVIEFAKSEGKPVVVNLSVGSNSGAHDGTSSTGRYLDALGEDAIICVSAGNEGTMPIGLRKTFTATDKEIKSFFKDNYVAGTYSGATTFWSNDDTPFTITAFIYDLNSDAIIYSLPAINESTSGEFITVGSSSYGTSVTYKSTEFDKAFTGYFGVMTDISTDNNRYMATVNYELRKATVNDGNLVLGFKIEGVDGNSVYGYCDGVYTEFTSYDEEGWDPGTTNGTINELVCGQKVLSVGAYATRNSIKLANGQETYYPSLNIFPKPAGGILNFTSYGTLADGRNLPNVCAPGCLISTYNTSYVQYEALGSGNYTTKYNSFNKSYYWGPMTGTSQASPFAAGTIALWLQADPTLTIDDVKNVIVETSIKDDYVLNATIPEQWGAGKINVVGGLKYVLNKKNESGIATIVDENNKMLVSAKGQLLNVFVAGESALNVSIYNMSGQIIKSVSATSNDVNVDLTGISKGVYVIIAQGEKGRYSQRAII